MRNILEQALEARRLGISVLPPSQDGSKRPDAPSWKQYQKRIASEDEIRAWYAHDRTGIGWVTGYVSGGLTVIDFDDRSAYREFKAMASKLNLDALVDKVEGGYLEFSPNGAHMAFRCGECPGNQKLAQREDGKTVIETRGEGGFIIVAPTYGSVNSSGVYELKSGSPQTIARLSPDEMRELFAVARILDERKRMDSARVAEPKTSDDLPGNDYNARASWSEVLEPHGWSQVFSKGGVTHWRRPGKKGGSTSATTGYEGTDYLYVFSTSTPFESERAYSKFSAYGVLNHAGDFEAAAQELTLLGYGRGAPEVDLDVDISGIIAQARRANSGESIEFPKHLLKVTGAVGEFADWIVSTSPKPQPILAMGAAIAAMSTICGRKAMTSTGLRSNLYVLGVAESGAGKERAREAIRAMYAEIGAPEMASVDALASSSAIETRLSSEPSSLFLLDEFGLVLKAINDKRAGGFIADIKSVLLRLYGATAGLYMGKAHADKKNDVSIEQPNLSIYGTTTPGLFLSSLSAESVQEGLFSRLLVFSSEDPDPEYRHVSASDAVSLPESVVKMFRAWHAAPTDASGSGGNLVSLTRPEPRIVPDSNEARAVFDDAERRMRDKREALRREGRDAAAYTRVTTNARKLALVRACGESATEPEITRACAVWAVELAEYLTEALLIQAEDHGAESETEAAVKAVKRAIKGSGRKGATKSDVTRKCQRFSKRARDEALHTLLESGQVRIEQTGKTSRFWVAS